MGTDIEQGFQSIARGRASSKASSPWRERHGSCSWLRARVFIDLA
jgi:hypothetical protein